jgi:hypothetical protein
VLAAMQNCHTAGQFGAEGHFSGVEAFKRLPPLNKTHYGKF